MVHICIGYWLFFLDHTKIRNYFGLSKLSKNFFSSFVKLSIPSLSIFSRTSKLQVEEFNGVKDSTYVRWINDCEMIFKTIHPKNLAEQKDIHLKILTTTQNSYKFEYGYVGDTNKQLGSATRID